jgi:hypothetical protein
LSHWIMAWRWSCNFNPTTCRVTEFYVRPSAQDTLLSSWTFAWSIDCFDTHLRLYQYHFSLAFETPVCDKSVTIRFNYSLCQHTAWLHSLGVGVDGRSISADRLSSVHSLGMTCEGPMFSPMHRKGEDGIHGILVPGLVDHGG